MGLTIGALIVAIASIVLVILTKKLRNLPTRFILLAALAYGLSYTLYWYPVWLGATDPQYSSWAPVFINICFVSGLIAGLLTLVFSLWLGHRNKQKEKQLTRHSL